MCICVGGLVGTQSGAERAGGWESSRVCVCVCVFSEHADRFD